MSDPVVRTWRLASAKSGGRTRVRERTGSERRNGHRAGLATGTVTIGFALGLAVALVLPAGAIARADITPAFVSVRARALAPTGRGENVLVRARVENSTRCRLILRHETVRVRFSRRWRSCTNGRFAERVRFGPFNAPRVAKLRLLARNPFGTVTARNLTIRLRRRSARHPAGNARPSSRTSAAAALQIAESPEQSTGWAGYVSTTDAPVTSVSATWTVPSITCGSQTTWLGTWLGIDGAESSGPGTRLVFQDGVYSYCVDGRQQNQAWWESYPGPANALGSVGTGDAISASVDKSSNGWTWSLSDVTSGASYASTQPVAYSGPAGTAEWIVEDPGAPAEPFVSDFSPVTFTNMTMTTVDGSVFSGGRTWEMVQSGQDLATPSQSSASVAANRTLTVHEGS